MDNEIYNLSPDDHVTDWIPAYALGILAADEATIVTQHLADCAACQAELDSYLAVLDVLPLAAAETEPATALKGRLLERVRGGEKTAVSPTSPPWWQPLANALQTLFAQPRWQPTLALVVLVALVAAAIVWRQRV